MHVKCALVQATHIVQQETLPAACCLLPRGPQERIRALVEERKRLLEGGASGSSTSSASGGGRTRSAAGALDTACAHASAHAQLLPQPVSTCSLASADHTQRTTAAPLLPLPAACLPTRPPACLLACLLACLSKQAATAAAAPLALTLVVAAPPTLRPRQQ